ncbi:homoserine dehydrogenase [Pseudogemmobacter faecipullorum]|uniref:Homoserine dehydrogenase n=1 Tax=Pseudogemmobacter faecipullorum TaxID=2755041 RepID=A0ABS8CKH3_9RHOB|nr:homoserine dehydrogenase [Pseudogemmobacter faecipullorum]MCB5409894.1 homoserine dehydrogenase [Pseudogemmobacter faecipullorum]
MSTALSSGPLRLGLAGLGTVGIGLVRMLEREAALIAARAGRPVVITAVSARDPKKDRGADLSAFAWETDPVALATRDDVDVFIEVMGGHEGAAKAATEAALRAGKHVVSANKALLAHYGQPLAELAEANGVALRYEAAVAGGIPVIKSLLEGLAGNRIKRVMGVMNGTCNYILTRMQSAGLPYETVFEEARQLGYLEADPNLDVGGIDAGHKLSLLASIAFGTKVSFDNVELEGIGNVSIDDITLADDMGYRIKLLGVAQMSGRGLEQRMTPCLVPADSPLGQLQGGTNMVVLEGDAVGQIVMRGAGAGEGPTASAVMSDVIDIARGFRTPVFGIPATELADAVPARSATPAPYYLRMKLLDKPGALAKVATALGDAGISIDQMRQINQPGEDDGDAIVLIVTHKAAPADVEHALSRFAQTGVLVEKPAAIRIEEL